MIQYLSDNNEYKNQSRYRILRVINNPVEGTLYLETYNQREAPTTSTDSYHVVEEKEVNRLDIISNKYYGTPDKWWLIALANGMIDPFVVNKGTMLRIPSLLDSMGVNSGIFVR